MKELTIEQKAKCYDEALERARKWHNAPNIDKIPTYGNRIIEEIFTELAESEDERIKKAILGLTYLDGIESILTKCSITAQDIRAWLKKQGEQDHCHTCDHPLMSCNVFPCEKKQAEQSPINEPKFHEGEWLCENEPNNYARFIQILETVNVQGKERYRVSRDIHNDEDIVGFNFVEKYYHKFDITDVNDGDVLAKEPIEGYHSPFVAIYKKQNEGDFDSYCFIGFDGKFYKGEDGHSTEEVYPATKEQRDALMKAMTDAGYIFDFENKELKKIEQTPAAWSEADEMFVHGLIRGLSAKRDIHGHTTFSSDCIDITDTIYWLKSLKDRVQPQPKQEWGKEDEKHYCWVIKHFEQDAELYGNLINWFKSLKKRYTWKPSDEQMKALNDINLTGNISYAGQGQALINLFNDLKKLKRE